MAVPPHRRKQKDTPKKSKYTKFYEWADIIAGDYHMIRKYMPDDLYGKTLITNTITPADMEFCGSAECGNSLPQRQILGGRSFGTNVMEALLVALINKPVGDITPADYNQMLDKLGFAPPRREMLGA